MAEVKIESDITVKVTRAEGGYFVYEVSEKRSPAGTEKWSRERPFGPSADLMGLLETAGKESVVLSDPDVRKDIYDIALTLPVGGAPAIIIYDAALSIRRRTVTSGQP